MRNFEKKAKFQEDEEPQIVEIDPAKQPKPEPISESEMLRIQAKMQAEQEEFMSIKKALAEMGQTGETGSSGAPYVSPPIRQDAQP